MTATAFTHSLADRFFASSRTVEQDEALGQLLDCIANASAELVELREYGHPIQEFERVVRRRLGLGSLKLIREVVEAIAKPIEDDDRKRMQAAPIKSQAAGDRVKEDDIYYGVIMPALSLFLNLRERPLNLMTGREIRSGKVISSGERRAILGLRPLPAGRAAWTKLIVKLTLSGRYWTNRSEMKPRGKIYEALAESAVRNRKGKAQRAFKQRFAVLSNGDKRGIYPKEFLEYPAERQLEVIDCSRRTGGREPLDEEKARRTWARANAIQTMVPTPLELERELTVQVVDRLKTNPRN